MNKIYSVKIYKEGVKRGYDYFVWTSQKKTAEKWAKQLEINEDNRKVVVISKLVK